MLHGHDKPSVGQLVLDQEGRYEGHAHAVHGRLGKHGEQLVARPAHVVGDVQSLGVKPLAPSVGPGALLHQRQPGDLLGAQRSTPAQQLRAAHRHRILAHQEMRDGTRPVGVAEVQRGVELGVGEEERAGAVGQVDRDLRVQPLETLEPRQQPLGAEGRHHRQFDRAAALVPHHRQGVALHRVEAYRHPPAIGQPGLGELDPAPRATEQLDTEELLERGDLPADRALGQGQLLRRLGEALVARGGFEADQRGGGRDLASHGGLRSAGFASMTPRSRFLAPLQGHEIRDSFSRSEKIAQVRANSSFAAPFARLLGCFHSGWPTPASATA